MSDYERTNLLTGLLNNILTVISSRGIVDGKKLIKEALECFAN